ncbi:MAG: hypothetical protein CV045_13840, partial [Cyanobacteria bacterium M5B4]
MTDCAAQTAVPQAECGALLALYTATDGANWIAKNGWGQNNNVCSWYGVSCADGSVSALYLDENQLRGAIPPELVNLANLQTLRLDTNQLSGSIPPELDRLTNLIRLDLADNQLRGSIPPELANLTNVRYLYLANNELDPNVTDAALLTWLNDPNKFSDDWRNQRVPATPTATPTTEATATPTATPNPFITDCATQTAVPQAECGALLALYTATDGANWKDNSGWGQNNGVCNWYGVSCADGSVSALYLDTNQLRGAIPPALTNLTNVSYLYLANNQLDPNVTDAALLAWLNDPNKFSDDWRDQRAPATPTAT